MQIVYCEKCGLRISVEELEGGRAAKLGENAYVCAACAPQARPDTPPSGNGSGRSSTAVRARPKAVEPAQPPAPATQAKRPARAESGIPPKVLLLLSVGTVLLITLILVINAFVGKGETEPDAVAAQPDKEPARPPEPQAGEMPTAPNSGKSGPQSTPSPVAVAATPAPVQGWSVKAWTGDGDSGFSGTYTYTAAHNFGGKRANVTVNGHTFTEGIKLSGKGWNIAGAIKWWNGDDDAEVTGNSELLAQEFVYEGNPRTVNFTGLTPGQTYEASFYTVGWEAEPRLISFRSPGVPALEVNQNQFGNNKGLRCVCVYTAASATQSFTIVPQLKVTGATASFHLYALANRVWTPVPGTGTGNTAPLATASETPAQRQARVDRELQELRERQVAQQKEAREQQTQRAAAALKEHQDWFEKNPEQQREFKLRLQTLIGSFPETPAAEESRKLAAGIKLPGVAGRYVRVEKQGTHLMLAEVQVFAGGAESVAKGKKATQSAEFKGAGASRAVDGNTNGDYRSGSVSHTGTVAGNHWWEVDLGSEHSIHALSIWNRTDIEVEMLKNFKVIILNESRAPAWSTTVTAAPKPSVRLEVE